LKKSPDSFIDPHATICTVQYSTQEYEYQRDKVPFDCDQSEKKATGESIFSCDKFSKLNSNATRIEVSGMPCIGKNRKNVSHLNVPFYSFTHA
jgi:hypothetical protein